MGHGAHMAHHFSRSGLVTVGFDYRGFGRSEGRGGYIEDIEAHLADSREFLKIVMPMYKGLPKFALGLSLGGLTSYYLTLADPKLFDGAILMAPAIMNSKAGLLGDIGKFGIKVGLRIVKFMPEKLRLRKPLYGQASKNPEITDFVKNDPYAFADRMSLSTLEMLGIAMM